MSRPWHLCKRQQDLLRHKPDDRANLEPLDYFRHQRHPSIARAAGQRHDGAAHIWDLLYQHTQAQPSSSDWEDADELASQEIYLNDATKDLAREFVKATIAWNTPRRHFQFGERDARVNTTGHYSV